jgi:hypothetical protein
MHCGSRIWGDAASLVGHRQTRIGVDAEHVYVAEIKAVMLDKRDGDLEEPRQRINREETGTSVSVAI